VSDHDEQLEAATEAWRRWCRTLEEVGARALADTLTDDEIDLAEGLRHLTRMARLTLGGSLENKDTAHPYFWPALGPDLKMGGDNPQGLYLSAPINGTDTFRVRARRGSARWISMIASRGPTAAAAGLPPFGEAIFAPDLAWADDGTLEVIVGPDHHDGNWVRTDEHSATLLVRQFFGTPDDVEPMELTIENLSVGDAPARVLTLDAAVAGVNRAAGMFAAMLPMMQGELLGKGGDVLNSFATDVGDPTSTSGGVPGGNAVTARWRLEPDEALLVRVTPPEGCAYWDVQVGNGWYESWDYRWVISGLTCEGAEYAGDGSFTLVLSDRDPGTANWLEANGHREGHIAIRWQLSADLPIPACEVVPVGEVAARTGLSPVGAAERLAQRRALTASFDARFGP
jgi:hypothetical protein